MVLASYVLDPLSRRGLRSRYVRQDYKPSAPHLKPYRICITRRSVGRYLSSARGQRWLIESLCLTARPLRCLVDCHQSQSHQLVA